MTELCEAAEAACTYISHHMQREELQVPAPLLIESLPLFGYLNLFALIHDDRSLIHFLSVMANGASVRQVWSGRHGVLQF